MAQEQTPVLIVGGSLVGLTSALLLGDLGVPSLVVERHPGTAIHARAGHFHLGTTEMLRQVGLERTVREASAKTYHPTGGIIAVESLAGEQLATYVKELNDGVEGFSPTVRVFVNQDVLEPILREKAVALGATVRNRVEATALEQDDDGATVTLHDLESGKEHTVRARYVIAAARSSVMPSPTLTASSVVTSAPTELITRKPDLPARSSRKKPRSSGLWT